MTRNVPRRPTSSRAPVSRPRRVAGQAGPAPTVETEPPTVESAAPPVVEDPDPAVETPDPAVEVLDATVKTPDPAPRAGLADLFDSRRATTILVSVVVVLALAAGSLFAWDHHRGNTGPSKPSKQPVVISGDDATAAVDAAAKAAQTILTRSYQDYDKQIDEATALMTPAFAKQFRATTDEVKQEFVAAKTDQQARVVAQGIVHATPTEVQALLFVNYYVSKDGSDTTYTPYRVLVTELHTDQGWLVSNLDTK